MNKRFFFHSFRALVGMMVFFLIPPPTVLKKNLQKILSSSFSSKCRLKLRNMGQQYHFSQVLDIFFARGLEAFSSASLGSSVALVSLCTSGIDTLCISSGFQFVSSHLCQSLLLQPLQVYVIVKSTGPLWDTGLKT